MLQWSSHLSDAFQVFTTKLLAAHQQAPQDLPKAQAATVIPSSYSLKLGHLCEGYLALRWKTRHVAPIAESGKTAQQTHFNRRQGTKSRKDQPGEIKAMSDFTMILLFGSCAKTSWLINYARRVKKSTSRCVLNTYTDHILSIMMICVF